MQSARSGILVPYMFPFSLLQPCIPPPGCKFDATEVVGMECYELPGDNKQGSVCYIPAKSASGS